MQIELVTISPLTSNCIMRQPNNVLPCRDRHKLIIIILLLASSIKLYVSSCKYHHNSAVVTMPVHPALHKQHTTLCTFPASSVPSIVMGTHPCMACSMYMHVSCMHAIIQCTCHSHAPAAVYVRACQNLERECKETVRVHTFLHN